MNKGRILVVDDNRLVLATLTDGLTEAGYEVIDADNGDDAILLAREHRPDLALLDIRMEGKSGFDVAEYLRSACRIPFMFLSAFSDDETVAQVRALGAVDYLVKPLDIRQIVPAVDAAFASIDAQRGSAAPPAPPVASAPLPAALPQQATPPAPDPSVSMAVGVLMHRYSLTRADALSRLQRQAASEQRALHDQAERLLAAVECLAGSANE
ncbi:response regulator [Schlegelella sp. ID0723]|uniref:Response regulator n=1 Tax=Piscinibacter koreensis TaxID=2742824 RepID=A0A7Y6TX56_9BURK|nr:response regulator [Schlegelella koreensis]